MLRRQSFIVFYRVEPLCCVLCCLLSVCCRSESCVRCIPCCRIVRSCEGTNTHRVTTNSNNTTTDDDDDDNWLCTYAVERARISLSDSCAHWIRLQTKSTQNIAPDTRFVHFILDLLAVHFVSSFFIQNFICMSLMVCVSACVKLLLFVIVIVIYTKFNYRTSVHALVFSFSILLSLLWLDSI